MLFFAAPLWNTFFNLRSKSVQWHRRSVEPIKKKLKMSSNDWNLSETGDFEWKTDFAERKLTLRTIFSPKIEFFKNKEIDCRNNDFINGNQLIFTQRRRLFYVLISKKAFFNRLKVQKSHIFYKYYLFCSAITPPRGRCHEFIEKIA